MNFDIDEHPRDDDGRFSLKSRTEPSVSLATDDQPPVGDEVRAWVRMRVAAGGSLAGAVLPLVDLTGLDLRGADLATADLWDTNFTGADLTGADLSRCDARSAKFLNATMTGVNVCGTDFTGAWLPIGTAMDGALYDDATRWPDGFPPPVRGVVVDDDPAGS
jgi:hypothetical protein